MSLILIEKYVVSWSYRTRCGRHAESDCHNTKLSLNHLWYNFHSSCVRERAFYNPRAVRGPLLFLSRQFRPPFMSSIRPSRLEQGKPRRYGGETDGMVWYGM